MSEPIEDLYYVLTGNDYLSIKTDDGVLDKWQHFRWQCFGRAHTFDTAVDIMRSYHIGRENAIMVPLGKIRSINNYEMYDEGVCRFRYNNKDYVRNEDTRIYELVK